MNAVLLNGALWLAWGAYWSAAARSAAVTRASEGMLGRLQHLVPLALAFILVFHDPRVRLFKDFALPPGAVRAAIGSSLTAAGLLFAIWARVHLGRNWSGIITVKEQHELIGTGPYRFVRHPIYTGFLAAFWGSVFTAGTLDAVLGGSLLTFAYWLKIRREETVLRLEFGARYDDYARSRPALVPRFFHMGGQ